MGVSQISQFIDKMGFELGVGNMAVGISRMNFVDKMGFELV